MWKSASESILFPTPLFSPHIALFKPKTRNKYTILSFQVNFSGQFIDLKEVLAKNYSVAKEFFFPTLT